MHRRLQGSVAAVAAALVLAAVTACQPLAGTPDSSGPPRDSQVVVDTAAGGGSDVLAREIIKLMRQEHLISGSWPVVNESAGGGLGAMAYLDGRPGNSDYISEFTTKWVIATLATGNAPVRLSQLTPIAELLNETQVVAASAKAPFDTMAGFVAAARKSPGQLVQSGGAATSVDNMAGLYIQQHTGTKWKYLSYADGAPRITALLNGDAQIDIGSVSDFSAEVAAGKLKLIGVFGNQRLSEYPKVPTVAQEGLDVSKLPDQLQFRGIAGPPDMPPSATAYYLRILRKLAASPAWKRYLASQGDAPAFLTGKALDDALSSFTSSMTALAASAPKGSL